VNKPAENLLFCNLSFFFSSDSFSGDAALSASAGCSLSSLSSSSSSLSSLSLSGAPNGLAGFSLLRGSEPGAAKLDKDFPAPRADPNVLPPNGLPPNVLPLDPDERPAKGEAPPEPPNVSLGGAAGCAAVDEEGEANELSEGLPAAREPNALPP
jgi:hypothetical protein